MDEVAVIILNYNTWKETLEEAKLVHKLFHIEWQQIIIIDNCSSNESQTELSKKEIGKYIFLISETNGGYASGNNVGLRYAKNMGFKYAWILNNDIIIEDANVLQKMIRVLKIDSSVAIVNPDVYAPDGHMFNRDAVRPTFYDLTIGMLNYRKKGRKVEDKGGYCYVYRPQGCSMLVDLSKMDEVEYMDENTFLYSEEPILAERLLRKNYKCACCTEVSVIHNHSATVKTTNGRKKIRKMKNTSLKYYLSIYRHYSRVQVFIAVVFNSLKLALEDLRDIKILIRKW